MKTFLFSLLLSVLVILPTWADSHIGEPAVEKEQGLQVTIDMDEGEISGDQSSQEALEKKIKRKVLSIFSDIIDAADEDLTREERKEAEDRIEQKIERTIEQLVEPDDEREEAHHVSVKGVDRTLEFVEAGLGAMAIFFIFGTPIMIIAAVLYSSYRKKRLMHDTINQYVASGKDIPEEVLKGLQKESTPRSNLHKGLVMSGIGLGIFACFTVIGAIEAGAFGLIPLFIGLAQLLIWKLENK